jgi:Arc/MetJ-type ribon-helix-helix transcriptional regulator
VLVSTQIAIRLPDSLVAWIDEQVAHGAGSRAEVARKALIRYRRQLDAEHDAEIYRQTGDTLDWDDWLRHRDYSELSDLD